MKAMIVWRATMKNANPAVLAAAAKSRASFTANRDRSQKRGGSSYTVRIQGKDVFSNDDLVRDVRRVLRLASALRKRFPGVLDDSEIDIGLLVGADRSFAPSVTFEPALLLEAAERGISLVVSAYPVSDAKK